MSICKVCKKNSTKNPQLYYFRFPKENQRCADWAEKCNLVEEFQKRGATGFYNSFRICSEHFQRSFIYWDGKKNRLQHNAVPDIFYPEKDVASTTVQKPAGLDSETASKINEMLACDDAEFRLEMTEHLCRLCGEEHHILTSVFGYRGKTLNLHEKMKYIPVKVCEQDVMPTKLCQRCIIRVEENFTFVSKCIEADTKLRIMLDMEHNDTCYKLLSPNLSGAEQIKISRERKESAPLRHDHVKNPSESTQTGKKFFCPSCSKNFSTQAVLDSHAKAHVLVGTNSLGFVCDECGAHFQSRYRLNSHRRRHFQEKPYQCQECPSRFYESSHLRQHTFVHSPNHFVCSCCHKSFSRKSKLISHLNKTNSCNAKSIKNVVTSEKLNKGQQVINVSQKVRMSSRNNWGRRYLCAHCGKRFTRMDSLKNHTRIHTGERPFSCSLCGFAFKQKGDCKKHEANHLGKYTSISAKSPTMKSELH